MTPLPPPSADSIPADRAVLLWRPDTDESNVSPNLAHAAELLGVDADAVVAAIDSGELLSGWFVDWQVVETR